MIKTINNSILFNFPEHESNTRLKISLQRTFRQEQVSQQIPIGLGEMLMGDLQKQIVTPMYMNEAARLFYSVHKHEDIDREYTYKIRAFFGEQINNLKRIASNDWILLPCQNNKDYGYLLSFPFQKTSIDQDMFIKLEVRLTPKNKIYKLTNNITDLNIPTIIRNTKQDSTTLKQECFIKITSPENWHKITKSTLPYTQLKEVDYQNQGLDYPSFNQEKDYSNLKSNLIDDDFDLDDMPLPFMKTLKS